jgi:hypothetical protein
MRRRQYLKATAVASTAGLAGCSGILGGGGGGPAGVAKSWVKAANNGNEDKVEKLTHSESPMAGSMGMILQIYEEVNVSVQSTEVLEEGEESATVEMKIKASRDGESQTSTSEMELRTEDGNWRVFTFGSGSGGGTSA